MHHDHLMGPGLMLQVYAVTNDFVADYFWLSSSSMTEPTIKVSENGHTTNFPPCSARIQSIDMDESPGQQDSHLPRRC